MPQLRYRTGDIPLLIEHFLERFAKENGKGEMSISTEAVQALQKYPFTGNVRELENVITKASVNANGREISLNNLPNDILQNLNPPEKDNIIERAVILTDSPVIDVSNLPKDLVSGLKTGLNAASAPDVWVETETLLEALKKIAIFNKQGDKKLWHEGLRCITIDDIHLFLVMQCDQWLSRKELAKFLRNNSKSDTDKYKTAGGYLKILKENKTCVHNGKHANRSRYRLAGRFIATAKSR